MELYPLKLKSELKNIIWGGTLLSERYHKDNGGEPIAEAWTLTMRPDGVNVIENGEAKGKTLQEYINLLGETNVCGKEFAAFPLLIKLIDAHDDLSVQVHPDDAYAHAHGLDAGKTEMWYIVEAEKGARIVYGLDKSKNPTDDDLKNAAKEGTLDQYLNYVPVKAGDVYFIPAGLIHAIGKGILIAEVQQNSNTTYRLYDYNRTDKRGNTRPLHVEQALEVIKRNLPDDSFAPAEPVYTEFGVYRTLTDCDFFAVSMITLRPFCKMSINGGVMLHILCTDGNGKISFHGEEYLLLKGESYLIPAGMGDFTLLSESNDFYAVVSMSK
jgi:mannose-6-phosphate isomerase, class I